MSLSKCKMEMAFFVGRRLQFMWACCMQRQAKVLCFAGSVHFVVDLICMDV